MSTSRVLILGALAGLTIFIGLPIGRWHASRRGVTTLLTATAVGILTFLLIDVFASAMEPVEGSLDAAVHHGGSVTRAAGLCAVFLAGLVAGLMALVYYDRWKASGMARLSQGPGAAAITDFPGAGASVGVAAPAQRLATLIAVGIGFHNFSEGLAIGQSAASGEVALATLLVIGFGLHNATEGFGIVAPFTAVGARPSWRLLLALGLIAGGPTFVGTLIGNSFVNDYVYVGFLTVAGGSILYVIVELLAVLRRLGARELVAWGLLLGLSLGFATDFIVGVAGA
ncbi:MAG: ZIP family metal transporter [Actinomycetes bacterium]